MVGLNTPGTAPPETVRPEGPSRTDVYHVLSNDRRRYALHYLLQQEDNAASKYELSRQIAAWENDVPVEEVTSSQRKRVYIALHQNHVPQMVDRGVVEQPDGDEEIVLAEGVEDLTVSVGSRGSVPWTSVYEGVGVVGGAGALAGWLGLAPLSALPGHGWAVLVAVAVAGTGVVRRCVTDEQRLGEDGPPPDHGGGTRSG